MKDPTLAPFYGCLYPGLCDIARGLGWCLAIHGTISRDLDLIAIPWTEEAVEDTALVKALMSHVGALTYPDLLRHQCGHYTTEDQIHQMVVAQDGYDPKDKPHGRKAYSLHLEFGAYIDLSIMPRKVNI